MNKKESIRKKSDIVSDFLNLVTNAITDYSIAYEKVGDADKATLDLLHTIEFTTSSDKRRKPSTQLHLIRKDRRYYKDMYEEADILVRYQDEFKDAVNHLKEVLGKLRKVEAYHQDRTYIPRILKREQE